jgi:hypothetical protein
MLKRDRPIDFFDEEEDEDYLIVASIENDKENDIVGFDDYMSHKPAAAPKPGN